MDEALKLKPCPFAKCGGTAAVIRIMCNGRPCFYAICRKCGTARPGGRHPTRKAAVDFWNDRIPEPWLPIETAPKDGTPVLVHSSIYGNDVHIESFVEIGMWDPDKDQWIDYHHCPVECHDGQVVQHWKPLPAPPSKEGT